MSTSPHWLTGKIRQDATEQVSINIRQKDIDTAIPGDGENCVAAQCVLRAMDAAHVYFYKSTIYVQWDDKDVVLRYKASEGLLKRVIRILDDPARDNSEIQPGVYNLNPPQGQQKLGVDRHTRPGGKKRPKVHGQTRKAIAYARIATAAGKKS